MVGPGDPPKETRFKPGEGGGGHRPKGSKEGLRASLNRILRKCPGGVLPPDLIKVLEQKTGRKITRKKNAEILALVWIMKAAYGNPRFAELVSKLTVKPFEKEGGDIYVNTSVNTGQQADSEQARLDRAASLLAKLGERGIL